MCDIKVLMFLFILVYLYCKISDITHYISDLYSLNYIPNNIKHEKKN